MEEFKNDSSEIQIQNSGRKMSIWIKIILWLVFACVVGGLTYYFVNKKATTDKNNLQAQIDDLNKKITDQNVALTAAQAVSTTPSTATTADPTAGWKTYSNAELKISFKYPKTWNDIVLKKSSPTGGAGSTYSFADSTSIYKIGLDSKDYDTPPVYRAYSKPINVTWTKEQFSSAVGGMMSPLYIKNLDNKAVFVLEYGSPECSPGMNMRVYIPTKNTNYPNLNILADSGFYLDPSIKSFEAKQQTAGLDACDEKSVYQAIADKVVAGTYSAKATDYMQTLELIAESYKDLN